MKIRYWYCRIRQRINFALAWLYVHLTAPWIMARFNAAWTEYQQGPVYRERLLNFGFFWAYDKFTKWEQQYCLKLRLEKEPRLRWKILIAPYSIAIPEDLQIAARQGYFNKDAKSA